MKRRTKKSGEEDEGRVKRKMEEEWREIAGEGGRGVVNKGVEKRVGKDGEMRELHSWVW